MAFPTEWANQGAPTAPPVGAAARVTKAVHTIAHSEPSSRRTVSWSTPTDPDVKSRFSFEKITARPRVCAGHLSLLDTPICSYASHTGSRGIESS